MIFLDLETSGLEENKYGILSLGALDFFNPENQFYEECQLDKGKSFNKKSLAVNGFGVKELRDPKKPKLKEVLEKFLDWKQSCINWTLAGHNVDFDIKFMKESLKRHKFEWVFGYGKVDTYTTAINYYLANNLPIQMKNNYYVIHLEEILERVGLPKRTEKHNALEDVKLEAEAYSRMIFGLKLLKEYKSCELR